MNPSSVWLNMSKHKIQPKTEMKQEKSHRIALREKCQEGGGGRCQIAGREMST